MFHGGVLTEADTQRTDYQPFTHVQSDFSSILKAFENAGSIRYETFNKLWMDMQFHKFYAGRVNERECREVSIA